MIKIIGKLDIKYTKNIILDKTLDAIQLKPGTK